jgi:hypothetical protein
MQVTWDQIKAVADARGLSLQWVLVGNNYWIKAIDGLFQLECLLPSDAEHAETAEFEADYKDAGNAQPIHQVTTQFEKNDKDLKIASIVGNVDGSGNAEMSLLIPGTPGTADGRWVNGGIAFFDEQHHGDRITAVEVVDLDNILGYGAGTVLKTYHDEDVPEANQGWRIPDRRGLVEVETMGGYGFIPAGLYIRIKGKKGEGVTTGTLCIDIEWARSG